MKWFWIPGNVPALKNSKEIVTVGKQCPQCKRKQWNKLVPSKRVTKWRRKTKNEWQRNKAAFVAHFQRLDQPVRVKFIFVRDSKRRFDYTNAIDTIQDEMVHQEWIEDDNANIIIPAVGRYRIDRNEPGVWIGV